MENCRGDGTIKNKMGASQVQWLRIYSAMQGTPHQIHFIAFTQQSKPTAKTGPLATATEARAPEPAPAQEKPRQQAHAPQPENSLPLATLKKAREQQQHQRRLVNKQKQEGRKPYRPITDSRQMVFL